MRTFTTLSMLIAAVCCMSFLPACISSHVGPDDEVIATPRGGVPEPVAPANAPPLILGPDDLLHVEVWNREEINRDIRADRDGIIHLPLVGRLNIAGQNLDWVRWELTQRLSNYYNDPEILVSLMESPLQKAFVLGEVNKPGDYPIFGTTTALQLIAEAGGFTNDAARGSVILVRGDISEPRVMRLDLKAALNGDLREDSYLLRGDIVYVNRTTIADVEDFARSLTTILAPIHLMERILILGALVPDAVLHGDVETRLTVETL
jgi:polysaccharide export outer membrane protein